jgi:hypothetical protein
MERAGDKVRLKGKKLRRGLFWFSVSGRTFHAEAQSDRQLVLML